MKKIILLLALLFPFLISQAQRSLPGTWANKMLLVNDSFRVSKERQNLLSVSCTSVNREGSNILLFPAATRNTKDQDVLFIGRLEKKEVYRVNLGAITSKNEGEIQKNLDQLFTEAANNRWLLFFDQADSLFSRVRQPELIVNQIQTLARGKNVLTMFWCEEDCLKSFGRSRYVLVQ